MTASRRLGVVVAGGRSSRFGSDKAAALHRGRPLIEHAAAAIAPFVAEVMVCGRAWPGFADCPDRPAPGLGPLGGIAGALDAARARGLDSVLTIACDMPDPAAGLLARLVAGGSRWCVDAPVLGCWDVALADDLLRRLSEGDDRSIRRWASVVGAVAIVAEAPVANVNTPADLAAL